MSDIILHTNYEDNFIDEASLSDATFERLKINHNKTVFEYGDIKLDASLDVVIGCVFSSRLLWDNVDDGRPYDANIQSKRACWSILGLDASGKKVLMPDPKGKYYKPGMTCEQCPKSQWNNEAEGLAKMPKCPVIYNLLGMIAETDHELFGMPFVISLKSSAAKPAKELITKVTRLRKAKGTHWKDLLITMNLTEPAKGKTNSTISFTYKDITPDLYQEMNVEAFVGMAIAKMADLQNEESNQDSSDESVGFTPPATNTVIETTAKVVNAEDVDI